MQPIEATAIVIVTYNRANYLARLLNSISQLEQHPNMVIIVDNASSDHTSDIILSELGKARKYRVIHHRLENNSGGSGGFHAGTKRALLEGAHWLWLMDDDVELLPQGLSHLMKWSDKFKCLMGRRCNHDGSEFHWQPKFNTWLAVPLPYLGKPFSDNSVFNTNCGCFEGMFIHRSIVEKIGLPDERFFITWDDVMYGWMASRTTDVVLINEFVIKRVRPQRQISLGIRHLNDASNLSRFYVMANRGHVAQYLRHAGEYRKIGFSIGTFLVFCKEILRLFVVERSFTGCRVLYDGWCRSKQILNDKNWKMPDSLH